MRAGGLTGTAAAADAGEGGFAARTPVAGAAGPGCSRVAVTLAAGGAGLLAACTRRVDGLGARRCVRARLAGAVSPEPFVGVLLASSPTGRLFPTAAPGIRDGDRHQRELSLTWAVFALFAAS